MLTSVVILPPEVASVLSGRHPSFPPGPGRIVLATTLRVLRTGGQSPMASHCHILGWRQTVPGRPSLPASCLEFPASGTLPASRLKPPASRTKSFIFHSYEKIAPKSFRIHSYKITPFKALCNHTLVKKGGGGASIPARSPSALAWTGAFFARFLFLRLVTSLPVCLSRLSVFTSLLQYVFASFPVRNHDQTNTRLISLSPP
jgi:hypothetical protein